MLLEHTYIKSIPEDSKALILGTIYPSKEKVTFLCDYFYGNDYTIWNILKTTFPDLDIYTLDEVKDGSLYTESAEKIKAMLQEHKVAISDTILETVHIGSNSVDNFDKDKTVYNIDLIEQIKNSTIETIYFTSNMARTKFTNNIYSVYMHELRNRKEGPKYTIDIPLKGKKLSKLLTGDIFTIGSSSYFERDIAGVILPSPSTNSVRGNSTAYQADKKSNPNSSYKEWRKKFYKEVFRKYLS